MRQYTTQHVPGTHLTFVQRQTLAADWNGLVRAGRRVTIRQFAARHGLRPETWRREYHRGAAGVAVPDRRDRRRRRYAEYDPFKAQDAVNENSADKGARTQFAIITDTLNKDRQSLSTADGKQNIPPPAKPEEQREP